ncbi:LOW QUALITY PROTEIN: matrix metalloproteinase-19-like [Saccoglossus kowalevskii]
MGHRMLLILLIGWVCHVTIAIDDIEYLKKYGYLSPNRVKFGDMEVTQAIKNFQRMTNLKVTGLMDERTKAGMQMPRCGVEDMIGSDTDENAVETNFVPTITKRYDLAGSKWKKTDLTFRFLGYTYDMDKQQQRAAIYEAFKRWSDVTPLTFKEVTSDEADIYIEFATRIHSDGPLAAFDGPGGTLAHAYFPEHGDMHFDDDEYFTRFSKDGINLDGTALHELGHSLGLSHSNNKQAVMYPIYRKYEYYPNLQLSQDDIMGIQALYGRGVSGNSVGDAENNNAQEEDRDGDDGGRRRDGGNGRSWWCRGGGGGGGIMPDLPPSDPGAPDLCTSNFDAVLTDTNEDTFAIKGKYIWKLDGGGIADGYPKKLYAEFYGIPSNINAGFTSHWTGRTYFFKGDRIWRFEGHGLETGYPMSIRGSGLPRNPDAALVWDGDGKIYVFKGSHYYVWSEYSERVIRGGVRPIRKHWAGIPNKIDAAFTWTDGSTYFFKGDKYWRFNNTQMRVDQGYPKSKSEYWLNCM